MGSCNYPAGRVATGCRPHRSATLRGHQLLDVADRVDISLLDQRLNARAVDPVVADKAYLQRMSEADDCFHEARRLVPGRIERGIQLLEWIAVREKRGRMQHPRRNHSDRLLHA